MSASTVHPDADLVHRLRALATGATVLCLGAHPDDEEFGLIAYLVREVGARTVYWSATRGEGGQNRIGAARGWALGVVRTWESLAAREVDGGEVLYGPFYDFGYVKTAEAAIAGWGHQTLVREMVRAIRLVQPQVVISRWRGEESDGHGHHQAIGALAAEAFDVAATEPPWLGLDRRAYPPWRPQKLYQAMAGDWQPGEEWSPGVPVPEYDRKGLLRVNTGRFDPVVGLTCEELAAHARNRHQSQGLSFLPHRGDYFAYYLLVRGSNGSPPGGTEILDGTDRSFAGVAASAGASQSVRAQLDEAAGQAEAAAVGFRPSEPWDTGHRLLAVCDLLRATREEVAATADEALLRWVDRKLRAAQELAARCLGISTECMTDRRRVIPGGTLGLRSSVWVRGPVPVRPVSVDVHAPEGSAVRTVTEPSVITLDEGAVVVAEHEVAIPPTTPFSTPYWLRKRRLLCHYIWPARGPLAEPFDDPPLRVAWVLEVASHRLVLEAPALSREACAGGFRELAPQVVPPVNLSSRAGREYLPASPEPITLDLGVTVESVDVHESMGTLSLRVPEGWVVRPPAVEFRLPANGQSETVTFDVTVPPGEGDVIHLLQWEVAHGGGRYGVQLEPVRLSAPNAGTAFDEASYVDEVLIAAPAVVAIHVTDASFVRTLRYAYIPGADQNIVNALSRFGLNFHVLSAESLTYADLDAYDTIVVGHNAYVLRDDLRRNGGRLLDYVRHGGTLVVEHQSYDYETGDLTPYPFRFSRPHDRVTFPDAHVTIIEPDHPVLRHPNKIGPEDFVGWVHDRGLYFFGEWDPHYVPLLSCHDPGDHPQQGGLLVAPYGQGFYVYAGYSFFRQIPTGVPGAVRLFANLLALAETKVVERMAHVRTVELFGTLGQTEAYEVARMVSERRVEKGTYLCRQGDLDTDLFLILEGAVDVIKEEGGTERVIARARAGEAVGELALLAEIPRSATLQVSEDGRILTMRSRDLGDLMRRHPDMSARFLKLLATKLARGSG